MDFTNRKIKPALVDKILLEQYQKIKFPDPVKIIHLPTKETSELNKIVKQISSTLLSFIYNYFIILLIIIGIIIYLWRRYTWYQEVKKIKEDELLNQTDDEYIDSLYEPLDKPTNQISYENNQNSKDKINYVGIDKQKSKKSSFKSVEREEEKINKKIEKNNSINSNMIKQALISNDTQGNGMSRENIRDYVNMPTKMVRFSGESTFDAYDRNLINPKTGDSIVGDLLAYNEKSKYTAF